jgi:hypothetical protein
VPNKKKVLWMEIATYKGPIATTLHENLGICLLWLFLSWKFVIGNSAKVQKLVLEWEISWGTISPLGKSTGHTSMDETLSIWVAQLSHDQYQFQPTGLKWGIQVRTSVSTINPGLIAQPEWESWCDASHPGSPSPIFQPNHRLV